MPTFIVEVYERIEERTKFKVTAPSKEDAREIVSLSMTGGPPTRDDIEIPDTVEPIDGDYWIGTIMEVPE